MKLATSSLNFRSMPILLILAQMHEILRQICASLRSNTGLRDPLTAELSYAKNRSKLSKDAQRPEP